MPAPADPVTAPSLPRARLAVVDVGSNSVRLVVFDGAARSPAYFFNEKVLCGLGDGLSPGGPLPAAGKARALAALRRFRALLQAMADTPVVGVATAAVRNARDGDEFVSEVRRRTGLDLRVVDGEEEARLSAQGVLLGRPDARGLVCDMGGASMELARVARGSVGARTSLPLGPLPLRELDPQARQAAIREHLLRAREEVGTAPTLHLVGGSFRALARLDMARRGYPLHVLHEYTMTPNHLASTLAWCARRSDTRLRARTGISRRRLALVPQAGQALRVAAEVLGAHQLVLSAYGLREGVLYEHMPEDVRAEDPLIAACRYAEARAARRPGFGDALAHAVAPLFPAARPEDRRLHHAACLLHDVNWRAHPDYRHQVCFDAATRANLGGLDHSDRVFLALALLHRYKRRRRDLREPALLDLLPAPRVREAEILGLAMRFFAMFTLDRPEARAALAWNEAARTLTLTVGPGSEPLLGEVVQDRLSALARALHGDAQVQIDVT